MPTTRLVPPPLREVEKVAFFDPNESQWCVCEVKPGTTEKVGLVDAWLQAPPAGMRVVTTRPS